MSQHHRTFRVSVSGGIDALSDMSLSDGKKVVFMHNLDVRSGMATPYKLPLLNENVAGVSDTTVQVFSYRGRLLFSDNRRSYAAEFVNDRERIYWTEYGGNPKKMVEGIEVSLGQPRPTSPPVVSVGKSVSPTNLSIWQGAGADFPQMPDFVYRNVYFNALDMTPEQRIAWGISGAMPLPHFLSENDAKRSAAEAARWMSAHPITGGTGSLPIGTDISFRLAYRTAAGILPPSGSMSIRTAAGDTRISLSWDNPVLDYPIIEILVFLGKAGGDEVYLTTLPATARFFDYANVAVATGALATDYDQAVLYEYCSTRFRNVDGVVDESGPSSLSPPLKAASSRRVEINPWLDGTLDSPNLVTWESPAYPSFQLISGDNLVGSGILRPIIVDSITIEPDTGRVLCTFHSAHQFMDGERIMIYGSSIDPFNGLPVEIQVEDEDFASCHLLVGESFVPPTGPGLGLVAYRVMSVGISGIRYNPSARSIEITTDSPHTFGYEKALFKGFVDSGWQDQRIQVIPDPNDATKLFVDDKSMPSDVDFTGCTISKELTSISYIWNGGGATPSVGDVLYLDFTSTGAPETLPGPIRIPLIVKAAPDGGLLVNATLPGATDNTGPSYATGIKFIPKNDYVTSRRIYRAGGTSEFRLVRELEMDRTSFLDAIPDSGTGGVLPTLVTDDTGVTVVVDQAPFGMDGLVQHYGMGFAWDPSNNRLRWTLLNNMDAWPEDFYRNFDRRILRLVSFNQDLCVFCEDGVYRIAGTTPTGLQRYKTKAAPCLAGGSVQFLNNHLIYLVDQGLASFNGEESELLTDLKIPGDFWLANSAYLEGSDPGGFLVPFTQDAAFERLRGPDLPAATPRYLMPYLAHRVNQRGIRSFIYHGKYFLYWGGDFPGYAAQTMVCVDLSSPGAPVSIIGIKAQDAFTDEVGRTHMILAAPAPAGPPPPPPA